MEDEGERFKSIFLYLYAYRSKGFVKSPGRKKNPSFIFNKLHQLCEEYGYLHSMSICQ